MEEKILLDSGKDQAIAFQQSVKDMIKRSNELIDAWHKWQDFSRITTLDDFLELIKDPVARLNKLLINSVDISIAGDKTKIVPAALAPMIGIDYESWVNLVKGKKISETCVPCKKTHVHAGKPVITFDEYWMYSNFLEFKGGKFIVIQEAVTQHVKSFATYTNSSEQNEVYDFWENVCNVLNDLHTKGYFGNTMMATLQKELNGMLMFSYETNSFRLSAENLANTVLKIQ